MSDCGEKAAASYESQGISTRPGAIERLDGEIERLSHVIDVLANRLRPVSTAGGPEISQVRPQEDSRSPLEGRAIRLGELTSQIDRIITDLDI
jgi:hypothetical protein